MPSKFVANSAERAGVSIETAEHRWKEAKEKVHKGKRKGSWYWGKVVNTFKRLMGLSEGLTFSEFLLLETDELGMFGHWPEKLHLYGPYVAERVADEPGFVNYEVTKLLSDEKTKINLVASRRPAGGASYTLGFDGNFAVGQGIILDDDGEAAQLKLFKKWAVDAMSSQPERWELTEAQAGKSMPDVIMLEKGYYLQKSDASTEFRQVYSIHRMLDDDFVTSWGAVAHLGRTEDGIWLVRNEAIPGGGPTREAKNVAREDTFNAKLFKEFVLGALNKNDVLEEQLVTEGKIRTLPQLSRALPETIMLKDGYFLEKFPTGKTKVRYNLSRLMSDDDLLGMLYISKRASTLSALHADQFMLQLHKAGGGPVGTEFHPVPTFDTVDPVKLIKEFMLAHMHKKKMNLSEARATSLKDTRVEPEWVPFTIEPISGHWPVSRNTLWVALDAAFGNERDWNVKDKNKEHAEKWKNNQPVTYVHHQDAKLDYNKLKAAGFRITFLPD